MGHCLVSAIKKLLRKTFIWVFVGYFYDAKTFESKITLTGY
jgi:hypothetical protein